MKQLITNDEVRLNCLLAAMLSGSWSTTLTSQYCAVHVKQISKAVHSRLRYMYDDFTAVNRITSNI